MKSNAFIGQNVQIRFYRTTFIIRCQRSVHVSGTMESLCYWVLSTLKFNTADVGSEFRRNNRESNALVITLAYQALDCFLNLG